MVQLVERLTLDFRSRHALRVMGMSPASCSALSMELPQGFSPPFPLSPPLDLFAFSLISSISISIFF